MNSLITFTSDFGLADEWAGVCRAVILQRYPAAMVVDICHEIPAFDIKKGSFILAAAVTPLAPSIHLAIVDPGVGGSRRILCLKAVRGDIFIGPDNGLLIPALRRLGGPVEAYYVENDELFLQPVSNTFHGRDIMAPVAASIAAGLPLSSVGGEARLSDLTPAPWQPGKASTTAAKGEIIEFDVFGEIHLSLEYDDAARSGFSLPVGSPIKIKSPTGEYEAVAARTYSEAEKGGLLCMWDSTGFLTIAANQARACDLMAAAIGHQVEIKVGG